MNGYTGFGQMGSPTAFAFGGGNIGPSPSFFQFRGPTIQERMLGRTQSVAELKQEFRGRPNPITGQIEGGINLLPAGALSRQEVRNRQGVQKIIESGKPYVEAPIQYALQTDRRGTQKYVNPITGQSLGTMSASWAGSETSAEEMKRREENRTKGFSWTGRPRSGGGPQPEESAIPAIPENETGLSGTPFADRTEYPLLGGGVRRGGQLPTLNDMLTTSLTRFGGIPRFPFAGY